MAIKLFIPWSEAISLGCSYIYKKIFWWNVKSEVSYFSSFLKNIK